MRKIWICPKCKSSSRRNANLKAHIKTRHPREILEPLAYDPLLKEYCHYQSAVGAASYGPSPSNDLSTYADNDGSKGEQERNSIREHTKALNDLSDYGDALNRFKRHFQAPIEPAIWLASLLPLGPQSQISPNPCIDPIGSLSRQQTSIPPVNHSNETGARKQDNSFWGFEGYVCSRCGKVSVIFVHSFPPKRRSEQIHLLKCSARRPMDGGIRRQLENAERYQSYLVNNLVHSVSNSFGVKKYLYCKEILGSKYYSDFINYQQEAELLLGVPDKIRCIRLGTLESEHWAMRSRKCGRTELGDSETNTFLTMAHASYAIVWAALDGLPGYYFIWIDGEEPYFQLQSADILEQLRSNLRTIQDE